jgi:predicted nucleic acid-binding protein
LKNGGAPVFLAMLTALLTSGKYAMNGQNMTNISFVIDTNVAIDLVANKIEPLPKSERLISIVTEMELFSSPNLTSMEEQRRRMFLSESIAIVPLTEEIKQEAIRIRRYGTPRLKLPDAIIASTAVILNATLVTNDTKLLTLKWQGLQCIGAR